MADVQSILQGGWHAGKHATAAAIMELSASSNSFNIIVLQIFDNTAFYARTYEVSSSPAGGASQWYVPH